MQSPKTAFVLLFLSLPAFAVETSFQRLPSSVNLPPSPLATGIEAQAFAPSPSALAAPQPSSLPQTSITPASQALNRTAVAVAPRLELMVQKRSTSEASVGGGEQAIRLLQGGSVSERPTDAVAAPTEPSLQPALTRPSRAHAPDRAVAAVAPLAAIPALTLTHSWAAIIPWLIVALPVSAIIYALYAAASAKMEKNAFARQFKYLPGFHSAILGFSTYVEAMDPAGAGGADVGEWVDDPTVYFKDEASAKAARPMIPAHIKVEVAVDHGPSGDWGWMY